MELHPSIAERLAEARRQTDFLFDLVAPEALYARPIPERPPLIFYLGHLEAFPWSLLCRGVLGMQSFDPSLEALFASAPGPVSDWPELETVRRYSARAREHVNAALDQAPEQIANVIIEHRLIHAEKLAHLLHALPHAQKRRPGDYHTPAACTPNPPGQWIEIPAGKTTLGQWPGRFGWDNEFPAYETTLPAFRIGEYKVTKGDYLQFVEQGGPVPHYWVQQDGQWLYRGMFGVVPLPFDHPVYVTHAQATAYARWKSASLPTEAQWHRAAFGSDSERRYPWGHKSPELLSGNYGFRLWDPVGVSASPDCDSRFGVAQMTGNGWEWTSSVFEPFPGFRPLPFYPDYSQKAFDGQHYVLKGGSCRTAVELLRRSFRNAAGPNDPYVYAAFRIAQNT